jgi:hypothetical protein
LAPAVVIPGHGEVFGDAPAALARSHSKLDALERDPTKAARHVVKVMFVFALLDRESMALADVPAYLASVPCYRQMAERFLGGEPEGMAEWLVADLERVGAVSLRDGVLRPRMSA